MLFDKNNYSMKNKKLKRDPITVDIIRVLGDLELHKIKIFIG